MSTQPVTADVKIGTVEGEIVETLPGGDFATGPEDVYRIDAGESTYRVEEADIQR